MSIIEAVNIFGIRSFGVDVDNVQRIKLQAPLTLFLGENGSGKTTIIEAIKNALLGDFPANNGIAFVSDPHVHNIPMVHGQVKIVVRDVNKNLLRIVRTMKLHSVSKNTFKFSDFQSKLKYTKNNVTSTVSNADKINSIVVELVGVRPSILTNVLLCHQDCSLWPLGDKTELKRRFDEIFETEKYNSIEDELQQLKKNKMEELNWLKKCLKEKNEEMEMVNMLSVHLSDKKSNLFTLEKHIETLEPQLVSVKQALVENTQNEAKVSRLKCSLADKTQELQTLVEIERIAMETLENEIDESDVDLRLKLKMFEEIQEKNKQQKIDLLVKREEAEVQLTTLHSKLLERNIALTQSHESLKQYKDKLSQYNNALAELSKALTCNVNEISSTLKKKESILSDMEKDFMISENSIKDKIEKTKLSCCQWEQEILLSTEQIQTFQRELEKQRSLEGAIAEINIDLERHNSMKKLIMDNEGTEKLQHLEDELSFYEKEFNVLQKNEIIENEILSYKNKITDTQSRLYAIKKDHSQTFQDIFKEYPNSNWLQIVEKLQQNNRSKLEEIQGNVAELKSALAKSNINIRWLEDSIGIEEAKIIENENEIVKFCGETDYDIKFSTVQTDYIRLLIKVTCLKNIEYTNKQFVEDLVTNKQCSFCQTRFDSEENISRLVQQLNLKIKDMPDQITSLEHTVEVAERQYEELAAVKHYKVIISKAKSNVSTLHSKLDASIVDQDQQQAEIHQLSEKLFEMQKFDDMCNKAITASVLIDKYAADIETYNAEIKKLQLQLKPTLTKDLHTVECKINSLSNKRIELRKTAETLKQLNEHLELLEERNSLLQQKCKLQKVQEQEVDITDVIKNTLQKLRKIILRRTKLRKLVEVNNRYVQETTESVERIRQKTNLESAKVEFSKIKGLYENLLKLKSTISVESKNELQEKYDEIKKEVISLEADMFYSEQVKNTITQQLEDVNTQLVNSANDFKTLQENLLLKTTRRKQELIRDDIVTLTREIGDSKLLEGNGSRLQEQITTLEKEISRDIGMREELLLQISVLEKDIVEKPSLNFEYRNFKFRHEIILQVIKDLAAYQKAMEQAVTSYHKKQIETINASMHSLWQQLYRGSDVDGIEILSHMTHRGTRRFYNYSLMQRHNDRVLEMRGRCSSSQKVLACLVVRLSIAELFSGNCGFLALDEPTANLDRENVERLAAFLGDLLRLKRDRKFQLLLISHDEDFITALRQYTPISYYYQVTKNNKGCSVVKSKLL